MSSVRKYVCYSFNNSVVKVLLLGSEFRIYFRESEAKLAFVSGLESVRLLKTQKEIHLIKKSIMWRLREEKLFPTGNNPAASLSEVFQRFKARN